MTAMDEDSFEKGFDLVFGVSFLIIALVAATRLSKTRAQQHQQQIVDGRRQQDVTSMTLITAFYDLILMVSLCRTIWFLLPDTVWRIPSYTPVAIMAWDKDHFEWLGVFASECIVSMGSLALLSIFILILVYWADVLSKYFHPATHLSRRSTTPMMTFFGLMAVLITLEICNVICFLCQLYTTEGMILFNSILLAVVSLGCVCVITLFSHQFRTVLKTLSTINPQMSTEQQIQKIIWITITGNIFFFTRAFLETILCGYLLTYWMKEHTVARSFSHAWWDTYDGIKFSSEVMILSLMLYTLRSTAATTTTTHNHKNNNNNNNNSIPTNNGYAPIPNDPPEIQRIHL